MFRKTVPIIKKVNESFDNIWNSLSSRDDFIEEIGWHKREHQRFIDFICRYIDLLLKKMDFIKVLEIGCGSAIDSYMIAERYDNRVSFTGTDLSIRSIELVKKLKQYFKKQVTFDVDDATDSSFQDETFDLIFSQGVVEHFKNPAAIMKEQIRLLKKDGFLIINVPQKYHILTIYKHLLITIGKWRFGWETEYSFSELKKLGESFGLKTIEKMGSGYFYRKDPLFHIRRVHKYFHKVNPFRNYQFFKTKEDEYENFCISLEHRYGHFFLTDIAVVFQKSVVRNPVGERNE